MNAPKTRNENIVVQEMGDEILIYDLKENKAFCLNETSALIYQLCNGQNSIAEITQKLNKTFNRVISEELIWLALDGLKKENLLENNEQFEIDFNGLTRRQVVKKVGLASMIALPIVSSLVAPSAANAGSQIQLFGLCPSGSGCDVGLTCRGCDNCPNASSSLNVLTCCKSATGQVGPGVITASTCNTDAAGCNSAAAQFCCSAKANFTVGVNIFTNIPCANPSNGTCLCGS